MVWLNTCVRVRGCVRALRYRGENGRRMSLKVMGKCAMEVILFDRCWHTMIVTAPKMHWGCLDRPTVVIYSRPMDKRFCNHDMCDMYLRLVCVCVVLWMVGCRLSGVVRPASADAASNFTTSRFTNTNLWGRFW